MRRLTRAALAVLVAVGCSPEVVPRALAGTHPEDRGPVVVVSLPLLADVVDQVVGGFGTVTVLAPAGLPATIDELATLAASDLLIVHGLDGERSLVDEATRADAGSGPRVEAVNTWVDPEPVNEATWFDPIAMAQIALGLGEVLAAVDDDHLRTPEDWRRAAAQTATAIATTHDLAEDTLDAVPAHCRRARGEDPAMLEQLQARFGVQPAAADDAGAADLRTVPLQPPDGQRWQDWFLALVNRLATADPECPAPSPTPTPGPTPSPSAG